MSAATDVGGAAAEALGRSPRARRGFFGHPWGLAFLAGTETWISFSYYGMQSLLVLYMVGRLLKPGHVERIVGFGPFHAALQCLYGPLQGQPLASAISGVYGALFFATPILGGYAADRWFGRTPVIMAGCVLMTLGHFLMASEATFLFALACLVLGAGFGGSLKAQVGDLYARGDLRRAEAFQLYSLSVAVAVIFSPIVCGALGERVGWAWGFGAAGIGMLVGLATYASGLRFMPPEPRREPRREPRANAPRDRLTGRDWRVLAILIGLTPVIAVAMLGNMEIFNAYLLWGQANFQLNLLGQVMPVSWLLSIDAFVSVITIGGSMAFWRWWARRAREPDEIVKVALGAVVMAGAPLILAAASVQAAHGHKVGLAWGLGFHVVNDIGFANLYAVGLALYSRAAPRNLGATVVNLYSVSIFLSNLMVGRLAGLLATMSGAAFWLLHAGLILAAAAVLALAARLFHRQLAPTAAEPEAAAVS